MARIYFRAGVAKRVMEPDIMNRSALETTVLLHARAREAEIGAGDVTKRLQKIYELPAL